MTTTAAQKIIVHGQVSMHQGAASTGTAFWGLCFAATGVATPTTPANNWLGGKFPVNTTVPISLSDILTPGAGTWDVGICDWMGVPAEWLPMAPGTGCFSVITAMVVN